MKHQPAARKTIKARFTHFNISNPLLGEPPVPLRIVEGRTLLPPLAVVSFII
jgi:hypothetical protein